MHDLPNLRRLLQRISTYLTRIRWTLVTLVAVLAAVDAWCEIRGLPGWLRERLVVQTLAKRGLDVRLVRARVGLWNGLVIDRLEIIDRPLGDRALLYAQRAEIPMPLQDWFCAERRLRRLELYDGTLALPLNDPRRPGHEAVRIENVTLRLLDRGQFFEVTADGTFAGRLELQIAASLRKPSPDAPAMPLTMAPILPLIPAAAVAVRNRLAELAAATLPNEPIRVRLQANVDLNRPEDASLTLTAQLRRLLWDGLYVERGSLEARVDPRQASADLRLDFEEGEYVQALARFDRPTGLLSGNLAMSKYPSELVRVFAPEYLPLVSLVRCQGPAPQFNFTMQPSAPAALAAGRYELDVRLQDAVVVDAVVRHAHARLRYDRGVVTIAQCDVSLAPDAEFSGRGEYRLDGRHLVLQFAYRGDPRLLREFTADQDFRRYVDQSWAQFEFTPYARPEFQVDLYAQFPPATDPVVVLQGQMSARALRFNGVAADAMTGTAMVDFQSQQLLVDHLEVRRNGAPGSGRLALCFGDRPDLAFDLESTFASSALLALMNPEWRNLLRDAGLSFTFAPYARTSGRTQLAEPYDYDVQIEVRAEAVAWREFAGTDAVAQVHLTPAATHVAATLAAVTHQGWTHDQVGVTDLLLADDEVTAGFTVGQSRFGGVRVDESRFRLHAQNNEIMLADVGCRRVRIQASDDEDLCLEDVRCPKLDVRPDQVTAASATAASVRYAFGRPEPRVARAQDLRARVNWQNRRLELDGTLSRLEYAPRDATADRAAFHASLDEKNVLTTDITVPEFALKSGLSVTNSRLQTVTENRQTTAGFACEAATFGDCRAFGLSGKVRQEGGAVQIAGARCERLEKPPFAFHELTGSAAYAFDNLDASLACARLVMTRRPSRRQSTVKPPPLELPNVRTQLRYRKGLLDVRDFTAKLNDGKLFGQFRYRPDERTGELVLNLQNVDLAPFQRGADAAAAIQGRLTGAVLADVSYQNDNLLITGTSHARVTDATIWKIPWLSDFFRVVKLDFGKITELECDAKFVGDRLDLTRLQTNGTVVSVKANGYYWWKTDGVDIRIEAEVLRTGWLLPLGKIFARRMVGALDDYTWESWTKIRDLFRDTKPLDPTIGLPAPPPVPTPEPEPEPAPPPTKEPAKKP